MTTQRISVFALVATVATFTLPTPARAQLAVEGRIGSAMPSGELTRTPGLDQTAGPSFAADVLYAFHPRWSAFAGVTRQSFHCDRCSSDVDNIGFDGGLRYLFPHRGDAGLWVRGGLILDRASVDGLDQDWGVGVDSGLGVDWRVRPRISVVPALRLNHYDSGAISLTYVTVDLGLQLDLGR